ncbi:MAG: hypothetical protein ABW061_00430 [Polyangiaceae bacterium]
MNDSRHRTLAALTLALVLADCAGSPPHVEPASQTVAAPASASAPTRASEQGPSPSNPFLSASPLIDELPEFRQNP